jgi:hypothetical protein
MDWWKSAQLSTKQKLSVVGKSLVHPHVRHSYALDIKGKEEKRIEIHCSLGSW